MLKNLKTLFFLKSWMPETASGVRLSTRQIGCPDERSSWHNGCHGLPAAPSSSTRCLALVSVLRRRSVHVVPRADFPGRRLTVRASVGAGCHRRRAARISLAPTSANSAAVVEEPAARGRAGWQPQSHAGLAEFMEWISQKGDWDGYYKIWKVRKLLCACCLFNPWDLTPLSLVWCGHTVWHHFIIRTNMMIFFLLLWGRIAFLSYFFWQTLVFMFNSLIHISESS